MSFIIQELRWGWSSFLEHARDAHNSPDKAGRMHDARFLWALERTETAELL